MNIRKVLESGEVMRYHATLIKDKQSNAEHQWQTALILMQIFPEASVQLVQYALTHDAGEVISGDCPAPVKKAHPELKEILDDVERGYCIEVLGILPHPFTDTEKLAVKYADILSGIYFTTRRVNQGDREAIAIRDKWVKYLGSLPYLNDRVLAAVEELKS